ncbi:MAG TPA: cation-translocating P-type ATPase [Anaerolineae bacterium]|nr:cation-translocating P-type ATPase [Anaerolineae bacterium]
MAKKPKPDASQVTPEAEIAWHALDAATVMARLGVTETGLSSAEVTRRMEQYGLNELTEKPRPTFFQLVIAQLNNFIVILLIAASVISALLGDWLEAAVIMLIVVLNAILGVVQESRAEEALAALKKMAAPESQVMRDGKRISVPASQLVPGDVVLLEAGNFVPADLRLLEAVNLRVEEAALTGESVPVQKNDALQLNDDAGLGDRKNMIFMGTVVNYGRGRGVVVATGMQTQLGMIADMLQSVEEEGTPLQGKLDQLGKMLGIAALAICGVVFLMEAYRSGVLTEGFTPEVQEALVESFMIAVGLAIAAVPEGLAAVVTISLALGMREMVKRNALIRRLASVETLGSATVICSDKTGTLTQNVMTVTRLWVDGKLAEVTGTGYDPKGDFLVDGSKADLEKMPGLTTVLWVGSLNNDAVLEPIQDEGPNAYKMIGDPTEGAMLVAMVKAWPEYAELSQAYPRHREIPFDSALKRMTTVHKITWIKEEGPSPFKDQSKLGHHAVTVKGAPDLVLDLCTDYQTIDDEVQPLTDEMRRQIKAANDGMTNDALRVMGFAYRIEEDIPDELTREFAEQGLIFAGLQGMIDPARPEVKPALEKARGAGLRTIMITGDYPNTGAAVAKDIGLLRPGDKVHTGAELNEMDDRTLAEEVNRTAVFARVSPEHKMRIVDALRANDEVVAMTGDGVNDAPAIKRADIGISMGITGTDVAKGAADMVLTDDNYVSIVSAVEQGRIIYSNIRKFVFFLLSSNMAEVMIIFLASLAGLPMPLTVIQLLWLNLLTDGAPALALAMEKGDPDIMDRPPRPKEESIVHGPMKTGIVIQTIVQTGAVLTAFIIGLYWTIADQLPPDQNPLTAVLQFDWSGVDVQTAETMAFVTLALCELFRAYTVRSERTSLFKLGVFSNKYMQYAVLLSITLTLMVVIVPFLQPIFNTHMPTAQEWVVIFVLAPIPAIAEEITKFFLRRQSKKAVAA